MFKCYAKHLGECKGGISREHYISQKVLDILSFGAPLKVERQTNKKIDRSYISKINGIAVAKILCEKHNHLLSSLDSHAGEFFYTIYNCTRGGIQGSIDISKLKTDLTDG